MTAKNCYVTKRWLGLMPHFIWGHLDSSIDGATNNITNKIKIYFNGYRKEPPHLHWDIVRLAAYGIIGKDSVSDFGLSVICSCVFWRKETTKRFHPNYFLEDICTGCIFGMLGLIWSRLSYLFSYLLVFESSLY